MFLCKIIKNEKRKKKVIKMNYKKRKYCNKINSVEIIKTISKIIFKQFEVQN